MRNGISVFVNSVIAIAYATMQHAGRFDNSYDPPGTTWMIGPGFLHGFSDLGKARDPDLVIVVAVPHDVLGGGSLTVALRVVAFVTVDQTCFIEPVWCPDAASDDGLKHPSFVGVGFIRIYAWCSFCPGWT